MRIIRLKIVMIGALIAMAGLCIFLSSTNRKRELVSLTLIGTDTHNREAYSVVKLTNASRIPIRYIGYETNSPCYNFRIQTASGFRDEYAFFCGNGVRRCVLNAHQGVEFQVPTYPSNLNYQISLSYTFPSSLDWLRQNAPHWIARRLPSPEQHLVISPLLAGTEAN